MQETAMDLVVEMVEAMESHTAVKVKL